MPVYLLTFHAYRSWREDRPEGYILKDNGPQVANPQLAEARDESAAHAPIRFSIDQQQLIHAVVVSIAAEREIRLHAVSTTSTHVHCLCSFVEPFCDCGSVNYCAKECRARTRAKAFLDRLKQKTGQRLAKAARTVGRPYLSAGCDITRIATPAHFDFLVTEYLPDHQNTQAGVFRLFDA